MTGSRWLGLELADEFTCRYTSSQAGPDVCLAMGNEDHGLGPATSGGL